MAWFLFPTGQTEVPPERDKRIFVRAIESMSYQSKTKHNHKLICYMLRECESVMLCNGILVVQVLLWKFYKYIKQ